MKARNDFPADDVAVDRLIDMQADIEIVANNVNGRIVERELDRDARIFFENSPIKGAKRRRPTPSGAPMRI